MKRATALRVERADRSLEPDLPAWARGDVLDALDGPRWLVHVLKGQAVMRIWQKTRPHGPNVDWTSFAVDDAIAAGDAQTPEQRALMLDLAQEMHAVWSDPAERRRILEPWRRSRR